LIQIDGFSKKELEKALDHGEMPCLKRLLTREHYRLYPHYPGLPSSTPAVQGELFYGQPQCVPAFFYYDRDTQKPIQMFTGADVEEVEKNLAGHTKGLLEGGSSYANIFSGGAQECHFCACSLGWDKVWKDVNPVNFILLCMTHFWAFLRMTWLTFLELVLACGDFFYGIARGENFRTEFWFIPIRASICIILRELVTVGAKIDVARGLPVVHLNFLGYDELAHRRGPSSKSAHWSLRGIDQCIANIYHSALHSTRRHYDVWVYSDHGQEETVLYPPKHGRSVNEAIEEVYDHIMGQYHPKEKSAGSPPHNIGHRVRYLGGIFQHLLLPQEQNDSYHKELVVVAKGVIGHVYLARPMTGEEKNIFAQEMVKSAQVPMVLAGEGENKIRVWNQKGQYLLPEQAQEVLGSDHPYLDQVTADLIKICRHPKAGDFVICGLRPDRTYDNFVLEHGDHGGPGINETDAFAILPAGMKIFPSDRSFLLTKDLRQAALHVLGRSGLKENKNNRDHKVKETIRIMTYNVHSCMGMDGKVSAQRVARVISRYEPDIIALQELDLSRSRSGSEDQPYIIAHHLEMLYHFHPSIQIEEQQYGNAILSRYPMQIKRAGVLPALSKRPVLEPRGALWAEITVGSQNLQLIASHLSLFHLEGLKQIEALLGKEWLLHPECRGPVILCGDFNATPASPVCRNIKKVLRDAQEQIEEHSPKPTWLSHYPVGRIDHVFVSPDIKVVGAQVPKNEFNKMVSDHLPLIVDISIKRPEAFFGVP
jgi:endonuclease/exonuclease/phosphatase family metal-dependent hydrolase